MDASKAVVIYLKLRARRARLAHNPPDTRTEKFERFTEAEGEQLRIAETALNRLNGAAALELLLANRNNTLSYLTS
jgi:hypothetical protein